MCVAITELLGRFHGGWTCPWLHAVPHEALRRPTQVRPIKADWRCIQKVRNTFWMFLLDVLRIQILVGRFNMVHMYLLIIWSIILLMFIQCYERLLENNCISSGFRSLSPWRWEKPPPHSSWQDRTTLDNSQRFSVFEEWKTEIKVLPVPSIAVCEIKIVIKKT